MLVYTTVVYFTSTLIPRSVQAAMPASRPVHSGRLLACDVVDVVMDKAEVVEVAEAGKKVVEVGRADVYLPSTQPENPH